jgi:hypothetical protein
MMPANSSSGEPRMELYRPAGAPEVTAAAPAVACANIVWPVDSTSADATTAAATMAFLKRDSRAMAGILRGEYSCLSRAKSRPDVEWV